MLVALAEREQRTGEQHADLEEVCRDSGLPANEDWLVRFINENTLWGAGSVIGNHYTYSLNTNGLHYGLELIEKSKPKSWFQRAKEVGPEWYAVAISLLSLLISVVALFRDKT
jgi:hypothetical protein